MPEFIAYPSLADMHHKTKAWKEFYAQVIKDRNMAPPDRAVAEYRWWEAGRPYYNCYPGVTPMLTKLNLDAVPMTAIRVPHRSFMVRLREDDTMIEMGQGARCHAILFTEMTIKDTVYWSMIGTVSKDLRKPVDGKLFLCMYKVREGVSLAEAQSQLVGLLDEDIDPIGAEQMLKLVCTVCMLAEDSDMIRRDVMANDRNEYEELPPDDPRRSIIENRAMRKGRNGWNIGRISQSASPHFRNPHPCLVHTGEGGKIPKIIFRRGAIVNARKATTVPTEFLGNDPATEAGR